MDRDPQAFESICAKYDEFLKQGGSVTDAIINRTHRSLMIRPSQWLIRTMRFSTRDKWQGLDSS